MTLAIRKESLVMMLWQVLQVERLDFAYSALKGLWEAEAEAAAAAMEAQDQKTRSFPVFLEFHRSKKTLRKTLTDQNSENLVFQVLSSKPGFNIQSNQIQSFWFLFVI
jgi:hypothetical protein